MSDNTKILVRNARDQDIPAVVEIDTEAFSAYGTAEKPETFPRRLTAFPDGFIILVADHEIAGYGCSEKWLTEREPALDENPLVTHKPEGRILCITAMAVKTNYRGRGYGLRILDKLIEIAHGEGCKKIVLETTQAQGLFLKRGFQTVRNRTEGGFSMDVMALDIESYGSQASTAETGGISS
ncbi:MAG: GNAT family N-acetyltransferase [Anaerolineales bacterium]